MPTIITLRNLFERYLVPGLVIQAVIVGGGYATGRELVEFFVQIGPASGLVGMAVTAMLFSAACMVAFELARRRRAFDYRSLCSTFLGRYAFLFETGYFASLLLVLAVVSTAAADLLASMIGSPKVLNAAAFLLSVAALAWFNNRFIERLISAWSLVFYFTYLSLFVLVWTQFGDQMRSAYAAEPVDWSAAALNGFNYAGYNIIMLPLLIFVARHFRTRSEALIAGALAGPLILLPGLAFLLALSAFYPDIVSASLPITVVLEKLDTAWLTVSIRLVILGALIKTGVGMLHGLNERIARAHADRGRSMPPWLRPVVAAGAMVLAVYVAATIGLIDLIGRGYRYGSVYFLLVFLLPLLTRGVWLLTREEVVAADVSRAG